MEEKNKNWIDSFAGLRFIIVVMLILHHFDTFNDLNVSGWSNIMEFLNQGYLSVNFFFVLSGFVIQYSYSDALKKGAVSTKDFLFYRIAHLWPTYVVLLFVAVILYSGTFEYIVANIFSLNFWCHFFMIQSWIPDSMSPFYYNALAWAVSTELFFYISFVFLVDISSKKRNVLMYGLWGVIFLNILVLGLNSPLAGWIFYINPVFRLGEFLLGIFLCELHWKNKDKKWRKKLNESTAMEIGAIVVLAVFVMIAVYTDMSWVWRWQVLYTIPVAVLIYVFSFDGGLLSKLLGNKVFAFLGQMAYPLYLVHQILLYVVKQRFLPYLTTVESLLFAGIATIFLSIFCAVILNYCLTKPVNLWLRKLYKKMKKKKTA